MRLASKLDSSRVLRRASLPGVLTVLCVLSAPLSAQPTPAISVSVGQRLRIVPWKGAPSVVGTFIAMRSDSVFVGREKDTIAVERNALTQIDQFAGPRGMVKEGMLTGLLAGAGLGALVGASTYHCTGSCWFPRSSSDAAELGAMAGAIPGMFLGAILGSRVNGEKWVPVSVQSVALLRVVPRGQGVSAQLSVSFH